ncbi:MAG: amidase [Candidatus Binatia bacterium]
MSPVAADVTALSLAELARMLRARETTALAVTEAHLARIAALDARLHAFVTVTAAAALTAARVADAALARGEGGPLAGVPIAVKDLIALRGVWRSNGSAVCADDPPSAADATVVARLRGAGAVILGTTHLHEFAFGPTGVNAAMGTAVNPWDERRMPGGSSSGSGVAVAARLVPAALGTDTGGSVRIPASLCGVTGLKPTYGRVSRAGVTPLAWTLDHVGPLARTAEDAAIVLGAIAGRDPADPTTASLPVPDYLAGLDRPLRGVRVGVPRHFAFDDVDPAVAEVFRAALADLRRAGAVEVDVVLPALEHAATAVGAVLLPEAEQANRRRFEGRRERLGLDIQVMLALGRLVHAGPYLAAQRLRAVLYEEARAAFAQVDLLALPATPLPAPALDEMLVRLGEREMTPTEALARLTGPFNLTGLPVLALPCGFTPGGLPVGMQLVGRPFAEAAVLAAGHAYQRETDWHARRPPLAS